MKEWWKHTSDRTLITAIQTAHYSPTHAYPELEKMEAEWERRGFSLQGSYTFDWHGNVVVDGPKISSIKEAQQALEEDKESHRSETQLKTAYLIRAIRKILENYVGRTITQDTYRQLEPDIKKAIEDEFE